MSNGNSHQHRNNPNNPGAQPFKGAAKKNMAHWSNKGPGHNNGKGKREAQTV